MSAAACNTQHAHRCCSGLHVPWHCLKDSFLSKVAACRQFVLSNPAPALHRGDSIILCDGTIGFFNGAGTGIAVSGGSRESELPCAAAFSHVAAIG